MRNKKTVEVKWFNGREFRRVTRRNVAIENPDTPREIDRVVNVVVTSAVWKHIAPGAMFAHFMGRREF